ncbi:CoA-binding protein [Halogeometricum pallidum JCM 14848]|uniref:CoA-binding protein n=1 Tax=Halogeometricum pallidum JCM 14848 TaxID=1227487 RepID=M0CTE1_HALPD|nr:CoA-binding protein [Halogeometricum pallidum]ELZ26476.1 CoA-binding protein [Halogeometricum pallidum JCM 14848]
MVSDDDLREMLDADTVAVVGCSTTEGKAAHEIPAYLQRHGYRVIPINPFADEILGETAYDSLADVPEDADVDLVDVFRPSEEAGDIVDAAIERHESVGDVRSVWLQLGITDDEAGERAREAGLAFVQDKCMKVEHGRLVR